MTIHPVEKPAPRTRKRRPLTRSKPLSRGEAMKRDVRMRPKSKKRARTWAEQYGGKDRVQWVNGMSCAVCEATGWTQNAHVLPRSRGGKAKHIVPLCGDRTGVRGCHSMLDAYELEHERDRLVRVAREIAKTWDRRGVL